jgi:hypothetical protein
MVLEIKVDLESPIDLELIEQDVKARIRKENVHWQTASGPESRQMEPYRSVYPD